MRTVAAPELRPPCGMLPLMVALRLDAASFAASVLLAAALGSCSDQNFTVWICLNPVTGKDDPNEYDPNHYVNGTLDPCHCFDPGGPEPQCPLAVDAGLVDAGPDAP